MARIPVYERQTGLRIDSTPNLPPLTQAPAQAVKSLGDAISSIRIRSSTARQDGDTTWFSRVRAQTASDWQKKEAELRAAGTYAAAAPGEFGSYRDIVAGTAPTTRAKSMYLDWAGGYSEQIALGSAEADLAQVQAAQQEDLRAAAAGHVATVTADPGQYPVVLARAMDDAEVGGDAFRERVAHDLQFARASALASQVPSATLERDIRSGSPFYDRLSAGERRSLIRMASAAEARQEAADAEFVAFGDRELNATVYGRLADGGITEPWLAANRGRLGPVAFRAASRAARAAPPVSTSPHLEADLLIAAYADGADAIETIADAYGRGALSDEAYRRLHATATRAQEKPHVAQARTMILAATEPPPNATAADMAARLEALRTFDAWSGSNAGAAPRDVAAFAESVAAATAERRRRERRQQVTGRLPVPVRTAADVARHRARLMAVARSGQPASSIAAEAAALREWAMTASDEEWTALNV